MITLGIGGTMVEMPEAKFGITFRRYNDLKPRIYTIEGSNLILCAPRNPELCVRTMNIANIPLTYWDTLILILSADGNLPTQTPITITNGEGTLVNVWKGSIMSNSITFVKTSNTTFSTNFDFVGRRVSGKV